MSTITTQLGGESVTIRSGEAVHPPTDLLGLDVETTYMTDRAQFDPGFRVRTVQFATKTEAWIFDCANPAERTMAQVCLMDDRVTFTSHTPMDVLAVGRPEPVALGVDIADRNLDTRSLAIMADPDRDRDRDLKTLAAAYGMPELAAADAELHEWMLSLYLDTVPGAKKNTKRAEIEKFGWNYLAECPAKDWPRVFTRYAGLDAIACRRLAEKLVPATRAPFTMLEKETWLDERANRITARGVVVDVERLTGELTGARTAWNEMRSGIGEITDVNPNGPKILDWLAEHGARWVDWTGDRSEKTGVPSLAKDNLALVGEFDLDDAGRIVLDFMQGMAKITDTLRKFEAVEKRLVEEVIEWEVIGSSGDVETRGFELYRIHPELNPRGATTTARMSSAGPNMQNFSKKNPRQRGVFLPEPGHVLATIDFAQIELRVVAALAREDVMIETIKRGEDLHQLTVNLLAELGITVSRQTAKHGNFLIVYGGGPVALEKQTRDHGEPIGLDAAREVVYGIRQQYPSIAALSEWLGRERDAIRTISNRRLPVTRIKGSGDRAGEARTWATVNYAVQSAARELLVDAWWKFEEVYGRRGLVWWPIHDELVLQIPEDGVGADSVEAVLADAEAAMTMDFMGVPIEASAVVLRDEDGVSRWMTGDRATEVAELADEHRRNTADAAGVTS